MISILKITSMKKNSLKKSVTFFSAAALAACGVVFACAYEYLGNDYGSNFSPEVYVDKSYSPLFFSSQEVFYGIGFDDKHTSRFNESITAEWSSYLKGKIPNEDLSYLLLNDSSAATVNQLHNEVLNKRIDPVWKNKVDLNDEKIKGFIEFMHHAKAIEASATQPINNWDYEAKKLPKVDLKKIAQVEKLFTTTVDPFLKSRYWFQTMKAYFYSSNKESVIPFFEKTKALVPQNTLYYRGLSYVAGAYYQKKDFSTSNYLYSIVFDKCPEMRVVMAYNFHPQEQADFNASLALAKTNDEKAALWALLGYYADEKTAIQEIYKLNPLNAHLDYLLTRLVNKEETRLNTAEFKSTIDFKKNAKAQINKEKLQLVNTIAKEGKTSKPYLWNMAAGYLNTFDGNYPLAQQLIEKAEKLAPKSELSALQVRLLKFVNDLSVITKMDAVSEGKLLPEMNWLYGLSPKNVTGEFRYNNAKDWSKKYISSLYQSQGNVVLGELFNQGKTFYRTESNLSAMETFLTKPTKTPWEKFVQSIYDKTLSDVYEYQAMMSAYANKIDEAITYMNQAEGGKQTQLSGNPFNGRIKDCHDCDHTIKLKTPYTKLSFLQKIKEMQTNVEKASDIYNNSLLLGNAFYNMTFYGNARAFYYGKIMNQYSNYIDPYYQPYLLNCSIANEYYKKAFDAATTPEQKAKCVYMMTKCERNTFYASKYNTEEYTYKEPEVNFLAWSGFKKLKAEYANTKYYRDVINECGYFKKYLGM
jgi:hypothetical protein